MSKWLFPLALTAAVLFGVRADDKKADKKAEPVVKVVHVDSGKVLGVEEDSDESAKHCVLAKDEDKDARQWKVVKDGDWLKLVNVKSGKVLDVNEASADEGGHLIIWDDKGEDGVDNQRFQWDGKGDEKRLKTKHSEMVLDVDGDGHVVQKKADEKNKKQLWKVVPVKAAEKK